MWHKFIFPFDQPRHPGHQEFENEFERCVAETEQSAEIELLMAKDRAKKKVYYLRSELDQECFDFLIKRFDAKEESDEPAEETIRIYPDLQRETNRIVLLVKEVLVKLDRADEKISIGPAVRIGEHGIAGEWAIQCDDTKFRLRLTDRDVKNLRLVHSEEIKTTIRQELSRT